VSERNGHHRFDDDPVVTLNEEDGWTIHVEGRQYGPFNKTEAEEWLDFYDFHRTIWRSRLKKVPWYLHPFFWWGLGGVLMLIMYLWSLVKGEPADAYRP
jgi:hypothetical protein